MTSEELRSLVTQAHQAARHLRDLATAVDKALDELVATHAPEIPQCTPETFFDALKRGGLRFFQHHYPTHPEVRSWQPGVKTPIARNTLHTLYPIDIEGAKFGRLMSHHDMPPRPMRIHGRATRGLTVTWNPQ